MADALKKIDLSAASEQELLSHLEAVQKKLGDLQKKQGKGSEGSNSA